ncbi:MAG: RNA polymerase sigma factor RpoS, partial [Gammaproteobacteria bacterium]|nr:RNA polymerase sigma factor RpoS [Gammaproteobacteria bacterium]
MAGQRKKKKNTKVDGDDNTESEDVLLLDEEEAEEEDEKPEKDVTDNAKKFTPGAISASQLDATRLYLNEIGFSPLLTAEEEVYYSRKLLKGDEAARKKMIECN